MFVGARSVWGRCGLKRDPLKYPFGVHEMFTRLARLAGLLFVLVLPIENIFVLPVVGSLGRLTGLLLLLCAVPLFLERGAFRLRRPPAAVLLLALYVLWSFAGLIWSVEPSSTVGYATTFLQFLVLIVALWQIFPDEAGRLQVMQAYVIGCVIAVLDGIRNFATGNEAVYLRFSVSNTDPNEYALVLALGIPMAYELFTRSRRAVRVLNLVLIPVLLVGIVLSSSRGGTVAAAVALMVFPLGFLALDRFSRRTILAVLALVMVAIPFYWDEIAATVGTNIERISTLGSELTSGTLNERSTIWSGGLEAFGSRPVLGSGGGTFPAALEEVMGMRQVAHNTYISVAVEMGLVGFALFVAILLTATLPLLVRINARTLPSLILLATLLIGIAPLSWEFRKPFWLVVTLLLLLRSVQLERGSPAQAQVGAYAAQRPAARFGAVPGD